MRNLTTAALLFVAASAIAAPPLFNAATESKWTVTRGGTADGTVVLLTSGSGTRAEWKAEPKSPTVTFLGGAGKVWMRTTGGDVELATLNDSTNEKTFLPALLLPFTTSTGDSVESKGGRATSYVYRGVKATYRYDEKGPIAIDVVSGNQKFVLTRTSVAASRADEANFVLKPKKGAAGRLARLSGDLFGSSDTNVSATAGGRGVGTKGLTLKDGGDYAAVLKLENRDAAWQGSLDSALREFQKDGHVGRDRENQ